MKLSLRSTIATGVLASAALLGCAEMPDEDASGDITHPDLDTPGSQIRIHEGTEGSDGSDGSAGPGSSAAVAQKGSNSGRM